MQIKVAKTRGKNLRRSPRDKARDELAAERLVFARKIRGARAILGWSQSELASRAGLSQPSIHRIERGTGELRHSSVVALEKLFVTAGITFETLSEGSFRIVVRD
jgi:transcriptional regulator with XRE-family HTH domain